MSIQPPSAARIVTIGQAEFASSFGNLDFTNAIYGYTRENDTHAVLTLLVQARARRVLEIGTALGHMTANFTRWTLDDAVIISLGIVQDTERAAPGALQQQADVPTREGFARFADHFGKVWKAFFITADFMTYDFSRLLLWILFSSTVGTTSSTRSTTAAKHTTPFRPAGGLSGMILIVRCPGSKSARPSSRLASMNRSCTSKEPRSPSCASRPICRHRGLIPRVRVPCVAWEGDPQGLHSLALVNRAICRGLLDRGHDMALI